MTLTEEADAIMMQPREAVTHDDIYKLRQIVWQMAKQYHKANEIAWTAEYHYNHLRASKYVDLKKQSKEEEKKHTENELDMMAKLYAESEHWKRREYNKKARSMYSTIEAINNFIITWHTLDKGQTTASNHLSDK